jgi:hypothetical protein
MALISVNFQIKGETPLLLNNAQQGNPMDIVVRKKKEFSKQRNKTEEIHENLFMLDFIGSAYWVNRPDEVSSSNFFDGFSGPYLPIQHVKATAVEGGKNYNKNGTNIKKALIIDSVDLSMPGVPSTATAEQLWNMKAYELSMVKQQNALLPKIRFKAKAGWTANVKASFESSVIDSETLLKCLEMAGKVCGIGDYRVQKGGGFGRFVVLRFEEIGKL